MPELTCSAEGCFRITYARKLCNLHYQRWRKAYQGPPLSGLSFEERFWAKVSREGPVSTHRPELGPCWTWTAARTKGGYGTFGTGSRLVHRISYELLVGPIPEGLELDHLCRNRQCVRPEHLEPVTPKENQRRGFSVSGLNARKAHCDSGHEFNEANTHLTKNGARRCRACARERMRSYRQAAQA